MDIPTRPGRSEPRVAIIHYWLVAMRGGEKVLEELLALFPQAEIFTHVVDRDRISAQIRQHSITETFIGRLPGAKKHYQKYLGLMPRALEELDLADFDLILSSESGPAKGVIGAPGSLHVSYVHSPMRYIWDHYPGYRDRTPALMRPYFARVAHRLRQWDVTSAARVDRFVANSRFVAERIHRVWNREADVVHPPVDLEAYRLAAQPGPRDYYLFVSQLVGYKRADLVIEAFRGLPQRLIVVGEGAERKRLERDLPPNVTLLGRAPAEDMPGLYQGARALVFPAEEDFGIVPLEAMACGTPVLAYGRGGALDSQIDGETGLFFFEQSVPALRACIEAFETYAEAFDPATIAAQAATFAPARFRRDFAAAVGRAVEERAQRMARRSGGLGHG
ncbi:MAG: glycosyltransferase [Paracoccaceae bacterium]